MAEQDQWEILESILDDIDDLIAKTKQQRQEAHQLETEAAYLHSKGQASDLSYQIDKQRLTRTQRNIDFCLRNLENQKKITLLKLRELE